MKFALRARDVLLRRMKLLRNEVFANANIGKFYFISEGYFMAKPLHIAPAILHFSQSFFLFPLDKSEIRAIMTKSLRHNHISGGVPEWPKGTDCKSAAFRFDGSNPSSPTTKRPILSGLVFLCVWMAGGRIRRSKMRQSGGLSLDAGSTASTPLFSFPTGE